MFGDLSSIDISILRYYEGLITEFLGNNKHKFEVEEYFSLLYRVFTLIGEKFMLRLSFTLTQSYLKNYACMIEWMGE